jgi:CHASE3 domain sensor protein
MEQPQHASARLRRGRLALWLAVAGAVVVVTINEIGYAQARQTLQVLADRYERRLAVTRLWRQLLEAETGQRGFLLTGRDSYLEPYHEALQDIERSLQRLRELRPARRNSHPRWPASRKARARSWPSCRPRSICT